MVEPGVVLSGRYRLVRPIGEGGMGAVWEAENTTVGRRVAVKLLHVNYARKAEIVERFEREARAAAAIGHDNIIDVQEFGVHDGQPFMVMEFLAGESLAGRLEKGGRLSLGETVTVMNQVLSALAAAHAVGVVHRDLKPENVFLVKKPSGREIVKLLDFGISKIEGDDKSSKGLTQSGALMGTPMYMAPEQALAKRDIDARADVYSAGVMLYEMVTGALPFEAESQTELLMKIVYRPDGVRSPRALNAELPPEFEAVVLRAMAREREERFATAQELADALAPWKEPGAPGFDVLAPVSRTSLAAPEAAAGPPRAATLSGTSLAVPMKKSRTPLVFAGAAAVALAIGLGTLALHARGAPPAARPASAAPSPDVAIDVGGVPANGQLRVDDHDAPSTHLVFARGSTHRIEVTAPGMHTVTTDVVADRDRAVVIELVPEPVAPPAPQPPPAAPAPVATARRAPAGARPGPAAARPARPAASSPSGGAQARGGLLPVSNEF